MKYKYQQFHQTIKLDRFVTTPTTEWPKHWIEINYKAYPRFEAIKLPKPETLSENVFDTLLKRESCREYGNKIIDLNTFSNLLYYTVGMKNQERRMYASAGGRYPCEVYLVWNGVLYHYHVKSHSLEKMWPVSVDVLKDSIAMEWAFDAPVFMFISGVFSRTTNKYKDRGYVYVHQEVGAIWQTTYLVTEALGLGTCAIGGFNDDKLNKLIDLDGEVESTLGVMTIGFKK